MKMKVLGYVIIVSVLFTGIKNSLYAYGFDNAKAKVTIKIVDENENSVNNAKVGVGFSNIKKRSQGIKIDNPKGLTDTNGLFSAEGETYGELGYSARKKNYYTTFAQYRGWFGNKKAKIVDGRWEPWNPTIKVILKKIIDPIPMFVKRMRLNLPNKCTQRGFDLEKGDWVAPYGKGIHSDFIFDRIWEDKSNTEYNYELDIRFSNPGDGIQQFETIPSGREF